MGLLSMMEGSAPPQQAIQNDDAAKQAAQTEKQSNKVDYDVVYRDVKQRVHSSVIENFNTSGVTSVDPEAMKKFLLEEISNDKYGVPRGDREPLAQEMYNDILGYGPIQELVDSDDYSEIMVNGPNQIYVEHKGKLKLTDIKFRDEEHLMNTIDRIVSAVGRHIDEASPMVDARLPDGSRVNVIIPPLSLVGAVLTIRKFGKKPITAKQLVEWGSLSPKMLNFLEACVKGKLNIIVSGGTGSGKTTLLNVLSSYIPSDERIVTIEDSAEVQLHQDHVVTLESRPANIEGKGAITIRDLVVNALRMRPDRIIVGEVRSKETLDMLQAMNTGHDGSLTTTHANSPRDAVSRLETMVMMGGVELPSKAIRDQIASAIDLIVQQSRLRDGTRKVVSVTEVTGMEGNVVQMPDIFKYEHTGETGVDGKFIGDFVATGIIPNALEKIRENGVAVNNDWFTN
ncbi:MAG: CpaF family protein [Eubacterium sp.]